MHACNESQWATGKQINLILLMNRKLRLTWETSISVSHRVYLNVLPEYHNWCQIWQLVYSEEVHIYIHISLGKIRVYSPATMSYISHITPHVNDVTARCLAMVKTHEALQLALEHCSSLQLYIIGWSKVIVYCMWNLIRLCCVQWSIYQCNLMN